MGTLKQRLAELFTRAGFRRHLANLSWIFGARIFTMGISFLATVVVARALGPGNFGELDYALAIIGLGSIIANFGFTELLYRELIKHPERRGALLGTVFVLRLGTGLITALAIIGFAFFSPIDTVSRTLLIVLAAMIPLDTLALFTQPFMAEARSKVPSLISMAGWTIAAIMKIVLIALGHGVIWIALTYILEHALYGIAYYLSYRRMLGQSVRFTFAPSLVPMFFKAGVTILLSGTFVMLYMRIDQILIRHFLDADAVGFYSAAVRLIEIANIIPSALVVGLYPAVLGVRQSSEERYVNRVRFQFLILISCSLVVMLGFLLIAETLVELVFGAAFLPSVSVLSIYALGFPAIFTIGKIIDVLYTDNLLRTLVLTTGLSALINISLNLLWIPEYGIEGAAWATVASFYLACVVPFFIPRSRRSMLAILRFKK